MDSQNRSESSTTPIIIHRRPRRLDTPDLGPHIGWEGLTRRPPQSRASLSSQRHAHLTRTAATLGQTIAGSAISRLSAITYSEDEIDELVRSTTLTVSHTAVETLLQSLPLVLLNDLPEGNKDCPICIESYDVPRSSESPVRLPCSHVMGKECLRKWLKSSVSNRNKNACPICRAVLIQHHRPSRGDLLRENRDTMAQVPEASTATVESDLARFNAHLNHTYSLMRDVRGSLEQTERMRHSLVEARAERDNLPPPAPPLREPRARRGGI